MVTAFRESAAAQCLASSERKRTSSAVGQKGVTPAAARPAARIAAAARDGGTASRPGAAISSSASWTESPAICMRQEDVMMGVERSRPAGRVCSEGCSDKLASVVMHGR